jgi:hypothetical protein
MNTKPNSFAEITIRAFVSLLFCLVIGYVLYTSLIFNRYSGLFSIPVYGIIGSIFFYTLRVNIKNALSALLVLIVMNSALITHATRLAYLMRDLSIISALSAAIYIFYRFFYNKNQNERWLEPLILSALVATFSLIATLILVLANNAMNAVTFRWLYSVTKLYFIIGLGIGLGMILTEEQYRNTIRKYLLKLFRP